ncbi:MAG: hypothetical protein ACI90V_003153, partial [Bacillariaceae sp.]
MFNKGKTSSHRDYFCFCFVAVFCYESETLLSDDFSVG